MKKYILSLLLTVLVVLSAGCSRLNNARLKQTPAQNQANSQTQSKTDVSEVKVTKDNVNNLNDDELLKMAEDPESNIDNLNLEDKDLNELDSVLNSIDTTPDIPSSAALKK